MNTLAHMKEKSCEMRSESSTQGASTLKTKALVHVSRELRNAYHFLELFPQEVCKACVNV